MAGKRRDPRTDDDEMVTMWGLVIEGYLAVDGGLMGEIADRFGLPPAQFDILLRLVRTPEQRMPMTRLAREAAFTSGGFTKVADRMAAAGLVRRERCDDDRRVVYVRLTPNGRQLANRARRACAQILRRIVLEPLGADRTAELAAAMRTLREANTEPSKTR
jgi:DNA-binding MarR family transcriptional regulator